MSALGALWVALIVALLSSVVGPSVATLLAGRQRREEKREDWARQDEIAARTDTKLDGIHVLVDGGYTSNLKRTLAALRGQLVQMKRLTMLTEKAGDAATDEDRAAQHDLEAEIAALEAEIAERVEHAANAAQL